MGSSSLIGYASSSVSKLCSHTAKMVLYGPGSVFVSGLVWRMPTSMISEPNRSLPRIDPLGVTMRKRLRAMLTGR